MKPELLAPGGSFPAAHAAFRAGADGVYLGLKEFSARRAAANFSMDQLRRLKGMADAGGKRIYVALNTVIRGEEIGRAADSLFLADMLAVDGVIVQDLGILSLCRRHLPRLAVHASTQMAVHDAAGVRFLGELGVRRVILSRELPLAAIGEIRREAPGVELEVFIHGALCYGWSGLCLASWALAGRSGNRGDCAQICRSFFRTDGAQPAQGHFFSCGDLCLERNVLRLASMGVASLKIEGRMKSPEYVHATVSLYRALLDRGEGVGEEELEELRERVRLTFARPFTRGFCGNPRGEALIHSDYPGHRGALLGTVQAVGNGRISVRLRSDLSLRDGVGYFPPGAAREPVVFSVQSILRGSREVPCARRGETVRVLLSDPSAGPAPAVGQEIRQMSSRFLDLSQPKEAGFPLYKAPLTASIAMEAREVPGRAALTVQPRSDRLGVAAAPADPFRFETEVPLDTATRQRSFPGLFAELLRESGDSRFLVTETAWRNGTPLSDDGIFVPPSELKRAKNGFYAAWERHVDALRERDVAAVAGGAKVMEEPADPQWTGLAGRRDLVSGRSPDEWPVAFFQWPAWRAGEPAEGSKEGDEASMKDASSRLYRAGGWAFLPLAPVCRDQREYRERVRRLIRSNPETRFAVGLNGVSHIAFARELRQLGNVGFFADLFLYTANPYTVHFLRESVPSLLFVYHWLEDDGEGVLRLAREAGGIPIVRICGEFRPPLFTSMGCPVRHSGLGRGGCGEGESGCPVDCPRSYAFPMTQGRNRFLTVVRDCVTTVFRQ